MRRAPLELHTDRLILRAPAAEDLRHLLHIYGDERVVGCVGRKPYSAQACQEILQFWLELWREDGFGYFCVAERRALDRCIGFAGVASTPQPSELNLFYWFSSQAWGRGFAREACRASLSLAFNKLAASTIVARTPTSNERSKALARALGMRRSGEQDGWTSFVMANDWYWSARS